MEEIKELKEIKENLRKTFGTEDFGEIQSQVKKLVYGVNAGAVMIGATAQLLGQMEFNCLKATNFDYGETRKRRQAQIESRLYTNSFWAKVWEIAEEMEEQFKRGNI